MSFQAGVGLWFAAHLATDAPVGARFGLESGAKVLRLQFETGRDLDDVEVVLSTGGEIRLQCKTRPSLSAVPDSAIGTTIDQAVAAHFAVRERSSASALVLAVAQDAPARLDDLEHACRALASSRGDRALAAKPLNAGRRAALNILVEQTSRAWTARTGAAPNDGELGAFAATFHIVRFDVERGRAEWREAARLLGDALYGDRGEGEKALDTMLAAIRRLISSGRVADREAMIGALRQAGHEDESSPGFDRDVERLRLLTADELTRLERHALLPIDGGVAIPRSCLSSLSDAAAGGSLLVIGEPGAGKTGVLVDLVRGSLREGAPTVLISVDRLAGVSTGTDLQNELRLAHPVLEVLAAWPGTRAGLMVVDALDASRGGPSEAVFASLIEDVVRRLGERWSVVASIRTFDLLNGRRFREAMAGSPPDPRRAEHGLDTVRHFRIEALSEAEVAQVGALSPRLAELAAAAPPAMARLLRNVFNLSLAADLIEAGMEPAGMAQISSQSELIDRYEDERIGSQRLVAAVRQTVATMVERRRLAVLRSQLPSEGLDEVLESGMLVRAGDRIAFAHHVLFDHAAGRFLLEWDDPGRLAKQLREDAAAGLLLGPSVRFAIGRMWDDDATGHTATWAFLRELAGDADLDPVLASVAMRTAAEQVATAAQVSGLLDAVRSGGARTAFMLSRIARFATLGMAGPASLPAGRAAAWAKVALAAAEQGSRELAEPAWVLLRALVDSADLADPATTDAVGDAARAALESAWRAEPPLRSFAATAITAVARTFKSNPGASRTLLDRILLDRFAEHAHEEAAWLAAEVEHIVRHDPEFVLTIYDALFGRPAPSRGKSWFGGGASRILPLTTTREAEYDHARWRLRQAVAGILAASPGTGTQVLTAIAVGQASSRRGSSREPEVVATPAGPLTVVEDYLTLSDWSAEEGDALPEDDAFGALAIYLRTCERDAFLDCIETARRHPTATSIWTRLLGVAATRPELLDGDLLRAAASVDLLAVVGMTRDAVAYLARFYRELTQADRIAFEDDLCARMDGDADGAANAVAGRLLSLLDVSALETPAARQLKQRLEESGDLTGNRAVMRIETAMIPAGDMTEELMARRGVDLSRAPDAALRASTRPLEQLVSSRVDEGDRTVPALWSAAVEVLRTLTRKKSYAHSETKLAAWAAVGQAVARIAGHDGYDPAAAGQPGEAELLQLLDGLLEHRSPEPDGSRDESLGWSNLDVRVHAACALPDLVRRFPDLAPDMVPRMRAALRDAVPTVRLQVAQDFNALWEADRPAMWELAGLIAREERSEGVLSFFLQGPLLRLIGADPDAVAGLTATILERFPTERAGDGRRHGSLDEALGTLAAHLWVGHARAVGRERIAAWAETLPANRTRLWNAVSALRHPLFASYAEDADLEDAALQERAALTFRKVLLSIEIVKRRLEGQLMQEADGTDRSGLEGSYHGTDSLLDHCCNQLYFGSGAFRSGREDEQPGLPDHGAMRRFLDQYGTELDIIARSGSPAALHHLIELYAHVSPAAPDAVFARLSDAIRGQGAAAGYQFESLGSDVLVKLVRTYLADHRSIFDVEERRTRLVEMLELFASAGWPEALRLLYDLPELLR